MEHRILFSYMISKTSISLTQIVQGQMWGKEEYDKTNVGPGQTNIGHDKCRTGQTLLRQIYEYIELVTFHLVFVNNPFCSFFFLLFKKFISFILKTIHHLFHSFYP